MHIPFPREQFALQIPFFSQVLIVWTKSYDLESISEDTCVNHTQESINIAIIASVMNGTSLCECSTQDHFIFATIVTIVSMISRVNAR